MSSYLRKYARFVRHIGIGYKALAVDIGRIPKGYVYLMPAATCHSL